MTKSTMEWHAERLAQGLRRLCEEHETPNTFAPSEVAERLGGGLTPMMIGTVMRSGQGLEILARIAGVPITYTEKRRISVPVGAFGLSRAR